jgi:hypothetical protein
MSHNVSNTDTFFPWVTPQDTIKISQEIIICEL